jgi:hypothetical protein
MDKSSPLYADEDLDDTGEVQEWEGEWQKTKDYEKARNQSLRKLILRHEMYNRMERNRFQRIAADQIRRAQIARLLDDEQLDTIRDDNQRFQLGQREDRRSDRHDFRVRLARRGLSGRNDVARTNTDGYWRMFVANDERYFGGAAFPNYDFTDPNVLDGLDALTPDLPHDH